MYNKIRGICITGKSRFIKSGKLQNSIRQLSSLNNMTPPVDRIFEANGTAYIDVSCYNGTTLDKLVELLEQREYIVPVFPAVPSCFTGRSTLVKGYISEYKTDYDIIVFLEYDGDFKHTFCDDTRLQISTLSKNDNKTVAVLPTWWVQRHAEAGSYEPAF